MRFQSNRIEDQRSSLPSGEVAEWMSQHSDKHVLLFWTVSTKLSLRLSATLMTSDWFTHKFIRWTPPSLIDTKKRDYHHYERQPRAHEPSSAANSDRPLFFPLIIVFIYVLSALHYFSVFYVYDCQPWLPLYLCFHLFQPPLSLFSRCSIKTQTHSQTKTQSPDVNIN